MTLNRYFQFKNVEAKVCKGSYLEGFKIEPITVDKSKLVLQPEEHFYSHIN